MVMWVDFQAFEFGLGRNSSTNKNGFYGFQLCQGWKVRVRERGSLCGEGFEASKHV